MQVRGDFLVRQFRLLSYCYRSFSRSRRWRKSIRLLNRCVPNNSAGYSEVKTDIDHLGSEHFQADPDVTEEHRTRSGILQECREFLYRTLILWSWRQTSIIWEVSISRLITMWLRNIEQVGSYWNVFILYRTLMKTNVVGNPDVADIWCCLPSPQGGRSSLHFASCKGHVEMVGLLIDRGADVKVKDKVNNAPVSKSLYSSQHVLMMDLLTTIMIMMIVHKKCNVRENSDRRQIQQGQNTRVSHHIL